MHLSFIQPLCSVSQHQAYSPICNGIQSDLPPTQTYSGLAVVLFPTQQLDMVLTRSPTLDGPQDQVDANVPEASANAGAG